MRNWPAENQCVPKPLFIQVVSSKDTGRVILEGSQDKCPQVLTVTPLPISKIPFTLAFSRPEINNRWKQKRMRCLA